MGCQFGAAARGDCKIAKFSHPAATCGGRKQRAAASELSAIFHARKEARKSKRPCRGAAALSWASRAAARTISRGRRRRTIGLRIARSGAVSRHATARRQAARQDADGNLRLVRRGDLGAGNSARGSQRTGSGRHHRNQDRGSGGEPAVARRGEKTAGIVVLVGGARLLPQRPGLRREGAIPHPLSRQAQPPDRGRGAAERHRRSYAGLSARGGQTRARAFGHRRNPGAQSSVRRPHPLASRYRERSSP